MAVAAAEDKPVDEVAARLGAGMRKAREIKGVAQAELARRLDTSAPQMYRWEAGLRCLDLQTIEAAERAMGLNPGTVLRLAGYVSDERLIDLGSLPHLAQRSISALLREYASDGVGSVEDVGEDRDD